MIGNVYSVFNDIRDLKYLTTYREFEFLAVVAVAMEKRAAVSRLNTKPDLKFVTEG